MSWKDLIKVGDICEITLNESMLMRRCFSPLDAVKSDSPTGTQTSTPDSSPKSVPESLLPSPLTLNSHMFETNAVRRFCVVVDIEQCILNWPNPYMPIPFTVVLISGLDNKPIDQLVRADELN